MIQINKVVLNTLIGLLLLSFVVSILPGYTYYCYLVPSHISDKTNDRDSYYFNLLFKIKKKQKKKKQTNKKKKKKKKKKKNNLYRISET